MSMIRGETGFIDTNLNLLKQNYRNDFPFKICLYNVRLLLALLGTVVTIKSESTCKALHTAPLLAYCHFTRGRSSARPAWARSVIATAPNSGVLILVCPFPAHCRYAFILGDQNLTKTSLAASLPMDLSLQHIRLCKSNCGFCH